MGNKGNPLGAIFPFVAFDFTIILGLFFARQSFTWVAVRQENAKYRYQTAIETLSV